MKKREHMLIFKDKQAATFNFPNNNNSNWQIATGAELHL